MEPSTITDKMMNVSLMVSKIWLNNQKKFLSFIFLVTLYLIFQLQLRNGRKINEQMSMKTHKPIQNKYIQYECTNGLCGGWSDRLG